MEFPVEDTGFHRCGSNVENKVHKNNSSFLLFTYYHMLISWADIEPTLPE